MTVRGVVAAALGLLTTTTAGSVAIVGAGSVSLGTIGIEARGLTVVALIVTHGAIYGVRRSGSIQSVRKTGDVQ